MQGHETSGRMTIQAQKPLRSSEPPCVTVSALFSHSTNIYSVPVILV